MSSSNSILIQILGKEFKIACPENEKQQLLDAADYLDSQMRDIRESGKVIGMERIAIMAALNLSHELLQNRNQVTATQTGSGEYLKRSNNKLDAALNRLKQLEI